MSGDEKRGRNCLIGIDFEKAKETDRAVGAYRLTQYTRSPVALETSELARPRNPEDEKFA